MELIVVEIVEPKVVLLLLLSLHLGLLLLMQDLLLLILMMLVLELVQIQGLLAHLLVKSPHKLITTDFSLHKLLKESLVQSIKRLSYL